MGSRAAAFFDLDRTVVSESTGFLVIDALIDAGLLNEREARLARLVKPVNRAFARLYSETGELWLFMRMSGGGANRLKRWTVGELREGARILCERLHDYVYAEARALFDFHRRAGRLVCIASSTGRELLWPLAEKLGVDHVIATEYEADEEQGMFTGEYVGGWLWGADKANAVKEFAAHEGVDLAESWAYTDSFFDRHLLELVGHPRAVNPDPRMRALASVRGWPVLSFRNAPHAPLLASREPYDAARALLHPLFLPFRIRVEGLEHIPREGPCILASNHRSYLDGLVVAALASWAGRKLRFLGKREIFDAPVVGQLARVAGQIPVDRGTGSMRPIEEALEGLAVGEAVAIFPQGTIPRGAAFFEHRLRGKTGVARLAALSGAPVIPIAVWDTEKVWPRRKRLPSLGAALTRPRVRARVGGPLTLKAPPGEEDDKATLDRLTQKVMDTIWAMLPEEVRKPPAPTPEQTALMTPPGTSSPAPTPGPAPGPAPKPERVG